MPFSCCLVLRVVNPNENNCEGVDKTQACRYKTEKSVSLIQSKNDTVQALREPHKNVSKNKKNPLLFKIVGDK